MPVPTLVKSWQHNLNNQVAAQASFELTTKRTLRLAKDALKGFGSNPWTVTRSSNGTSVNLAGGDLWAADSDLVSNAAGSNHSWIVLRNSVLGVELCFDFNSGVPYYQTVAVSWSAGYTGGSLTARPTASDERLLIDRFFWITTNSTNTSNRWSVQHATDGTATRFIFANSSTATGYLLIEKVASSSAGWTVPIVAFCNNTAPTATSLVSSNYGFMKHGAVQGSAQMLAEGAGNLGANDTTFGNVANDVTGEWTFWPLAVAGATAGARGRHGDVVDLWFGSSAIPSADTYPADGTNQFAQFSGLILPWNGGAVNLT
jgi:hypothetical protein